MLQGLTLGSLLYILHTNQLSDIHGEQTVLYADGAALNFSDTSLQETAQKVNPVMGILDEDFLSSSLLLNIINTQCILFGNRKDNEFS